jgi:hypothetical protein
VIFDRPEFHGVLGVGWCSFVHTSYRVAGISTPQQPAFPLQAKPSREMALCCLSLMSDDFQVLKIDGKTNVAVKDPRSAKNDRNLA